MFELIQLVVLLAITIVDDPIVRKGISPEIRMGHRDAENAAWLFCSLSQDNDLDPDLLLRLNAKSPSSFKEISRLCSELGVETSLRAVSYAELCSISGPSVVLLRDGAKAEGYFSVVIDAEEGEVAALNAGWMTFSTITEDNFRMKWTGHVLVPVSHHNRWPNWIAWGIVAGGLSPALLYLKSWTPLNQEK